MNLYAQAQGNPLGPMLAQMQAAQDRAAFEALIVLVIAAAIWGLCMYLIIKRAVRDGIEESGIIEATRQRATAQAPEPRARKWSDTTPSPLPDIRADR